MKINIILIPVSRSRSNKLRESEVAFFSILSIFFPVSYTYFDIIDFSDVCVTDWGVDFFLTRKLNSVRLFKRLTNKCKNLGKLKFDIVG